MSLMSKAFDTLTPMYSDSISDSPSRKTSANSYVDYEFSTGVTSNSQYSRVDGSPIRFTEKEEVQAPPVDIVPYIPEVKDKMFSGDFTIVTKANSTDTGGGFGNCAASQFGGTGGINSGGLITWKLFVEEGFIVDVQLIKVFCSRKSAGGSVSTCDCSSIIGTNNPCNNQNLGKNTILKCTDPWFQPWYNGTDECLTSGGDNCCECGLGTFGSYFCALLGISGVPAPCSWGSPNSLATEDFLGGYTTDSPPWSSGGSAPHECTYNNYDTCCDGTCA